MSTLLEVQKQISASKSKMGAVEGRLLSNLSSPPTVSKQLNPEVPSVAEYVQNVNILKDQLEAKTHLLSVQAETDRYKYEAEILKMGQEVKLLKAKVEQNDVLLVAKDKSIVQLTTQVYLLTKQLSEKQRKLRLLQDQLSALKQANTEMRLENKNVKADNKILMSHIDRLQKVSAQVKKEREDLNSRELRVIRSLYSQSLPTIESAYKQDFSELSNKIALDGVINMNGDLKSLVRSQNGQIEYLTHEKKLLIQEIEQKTKHLENQKELAEMQRENHQKLTDIIQKMGQKIMSLEDIKHTLKEAMGKQEGSNHQYETTGVKAGQLYKKKY